MARLSFAAGINETETRLICALSSMAAYENDNAVVVRDIISDYGWSIEPISKESSKANVTALLISKSFDDGTLVKILAICGTDDLKDAEIDFRLKPVPINLSNPSNKEILVHQGFQDYADVMLDREFTIQLVREISRNPAEKLYLTGHSLGGAVAIITAAKLLNLGINPSRMEVITFGAPAVGNQAFVEEYQDRIHLKRVSMSGDPIKKSLAALGYVHFGEVVKYNPSKAMVEHFPHSMALYLDCAIRDYYDINADPSPQSTIVYILKKNFSEDDFKYIKSVFGEIEYREVDDFDNYVDAGYQVYYLQAKKIRNDRDSNYRVSLEKIEYDDQGFPISMQTASMTTAELTMLEAVIFAKYNLLNN